MVSVHESSGDAVSPDAHLPAHPPSGEEAVGLGTVLRASTHHTPTNFEAKLPLEKRWPGFSPKFPWVPSTPPLTQGGSTFICVSYQGSVFRLWLEEVRSVLM